MQKSIRSDKLFLFILNIILIIFSIACVFPFIMLVSSSLTDEMTLLWYGYNLFPRKFSVEAYQFIFKTNTIYRAYGVTTFTTIIGVILSMIVTCGLAYSLAQKNLRYAGKISLFMYITILFSGGLVPYYILISKYLHMKNSIWALIIPGILSPWYVYMLRNFFSTVPASLAESAKIDGANDIYILFKIVLPVSLPAIATISLFYALGFWNEWFRALLFIEKPKLYPLQYIIMAIIRNVDFVNSMVKNGTQDLQTVVPAFSVRMATTVVTIGPIIFLYPLLQKYFVKGLTIGAVKG